MVINIIMDHTGKQEIRRDFIRNEVGNWSLGKHIFGYRIQVSIW